MIGDKPGRRGSLADVRFGPYGLAGDTDISIRDPRDSGAAREGQKSGQVRNFVIGWQ